MSRYLTFRYVAAAICFLAGALFVAIDASLLFDGATRRAATLLEQLRFGIVAATVPIMLSIMPFLFALTWVRGRPDRWWSIGRPSGWSLVLLVVWAVFVAYNIYGAGGSVSSITTDVRSARKFDASRDKDRASERAKLVAQRDAIPPSTRPAALLGPLLEAEKAKPAWGWTEGCRHIDGASERKFCLSYAKLASELGAAQELARLNGRIAELDEKAEVAGWVSEIVDPPARFWSRMTGYSEGAVQDIDPLWTPIILQLGSWFFLAFGLILAGFTGHREALFGQHRQSQSLPIVLAAAETQPTVSAALPPPATDPRAAALRSRQVELAKWFFAECARPVTSGGLPEDQWYAHYSEVCARSRDIPLDVETFRGIAREHGAVVTLIDGRFFYSRILPLMPEREAPMAG